jgi:hypothetical protein
MKGLRMKITHSTVDKILQTLSDEDHFNIIKVSINFLILIFDNLSWGHSL